MIKNILVEKNLRGYAFEYMAKCILRREKKNNFIFMVNQFDSIEDILNKYRCSPTKTTSPFIDLLKEEWGRCDIIELIFDDKKERNITDIGIYEVKTKMISVERDHIDMCLSNHKFMKRVMKLGYEPNIISIIIFENWRFSFNLIPYKKVKKRVHYRPRTTYYTKKT